MINRAVIIPTGNELKEGIILDTDSPMIMQILLQLNGNCYVIRSKPVEDMEQLIKENIKKYLNEEVDLIILIGGSGGGHRYSKTLGKDYTHSTLEKILDEKYSSKIYGKNGHLWCKLLCGRISKTMVINVPGPFQEARVAMNAFVKAYENDSNNLKEINNKMIEAVKKQYGVQI